MTGTDLEAENLARLTSAQFEVLAALEVSERQAFHGKSFGESIDDWRKGGPDRVLGLCFLHAGRPIGMTLFCRPAPMADGAPFAATIHGLKIATPWQGRGWGHDVYRLAVGQLKREWPAATRLRLAVDADNHAALAVYRGLGMWDSGPVHPGRHGPEHRMELALREHGARETGVEHVREGVIGS